MPPRSAGLLLHLTSLPSRFSIGDLGLTANAMLDWMLSAGLSAFTSVADRAIAPLQDVARLGSEARMNTPGRADGNWEWRARTGLRRLAVLTGMVPAAWAAPGS